MGETKLKMVPTRDGFGEGLIELGKTNKDVVVLSADLTDSTRAVWFKKQFPGRFFSLGVAEQDMIGTAAGFALMGKIPFACTFGVFASGRAWDQIRVSLAYMNLNVKIGGTHGGVSVGPDGATHQALEEIALMRILPNMTIIVPCDAIEARKATVGSAQINGPVYLRLGRSGVPVITREDGVFEVGKAITIREGNDVALFACGQMVYEAMLAAEELSGDGIKARVINMHTPKPLDEDAVEKACLETGAIVTAEEHTLAGGLGSAIAEVASRIAPVPIRMVGIRNRFGVSGEPDELFEHFGLKAKNIVAAAREAIRMKKR